MPKSAPEAFAAPPAVNEAEALQHLTRLDFLVEDEARAQAYRSNAPFPHLVMDDFLPAPVVAALQARFPAARQRSVEFSTGFERLKREFNPNELEDSFLRYFFQTLNAAPFLGYLERLTGIGGLCPDPYFFGGGFHEILSGGKLGIHADFRLHRRLNLRRRLNLLIYLNGPWPEAYGGNLELWDAGMSSCVRRIAPIGNRCVVFNTDERSYHGHPDPLTCPPTVSRRSVALYYYTASDAIASEIDGRGGSTDFRRRPGDVDQGVWADISRQAAARIVRDLTPPIILRGIKKLVGKGG